MSASPEHRQRTVQRVHALLRRRGFPYVQMTLLVAATGLLGFLASALLRYAGLTMMGVRYPVCVLIAWGCFVGLVGIWMSLHRRSQRRMPAAVSSDSASAVDAIDYYDSSIPATSLTPSSSTTGSSSSKVGIGGLGDIDGDGLMLVVVILIIVAVGAAFIAAAFVIYEAPILFAEVLVDGALLAGMVRQLRRRAPTEHWTSGVIRRTWKSAVVLIVVFTIVGVAIPQFAPGATTMGEAIRIVSEK